jgi:hypothetical protein
LVAHAVDNPGNQNPGPGSLAVVDEVVLDGENSKAWIEVISRWTGLGGASKKRKPSGNCVNKTIGSFDAAISRDVEPDSIKIRLRRTSQAVAFSSSAGLLAIVGQSLSPTLLNVLGQLLGRTLVVVVVFAPVDGFEPCSNLGSELRQAFVAFLEKPKPLADDFARRLIHAGFHFVVDETL